MIDLSVIQLMISSMINLGNKSHLGSIPFFRILCFFLNNRQSSTAGTTASERSTYRRKKQMPIRVRKKIEKTKISNYCRFSIGSKISSIN